METGTGVVLALATGLLLVSRERRRGRRAEVAEAPAEPRRRRRKDRNTKPRGSGGSTSTSDYNARLDEAIRASDEKLAKDTAILKNVPYIGGILHALVNAAKVVPPPTDENVEAFFAEKEARKARRKAFWDKFFGRNK